MKDVLIIDDEPGIRASLRSILQDERYRVFLAADAYEGFAILEKENVDLVFLDVLLPRMGGLEALERLRKLQPETEIVMISGHANMEMAVRAVKLGAFDFLEKPLALEKVLTAARNALALRQLRKENIGLKRTISNEELIGESAALRKIHTLIEQAAASDARILVMGENGTGKELVSREVHRRSSRAERPFISVNCAAIPDTLIESELFGHVKGAFTDAITGRKGRFELAHGGTLFLDEIGDMSLSAQSKVLRAIQELKIERVGGEQSIDVDVRIIAATNKDLTSECKAGRFREDLFFRLNVIPIVLPPLRDRTEDIPLLLENFLKTAGMGRLELKDSALAVLKRYAWPGNIRELKNFAERLAVLGDSDIVDGIAVSALLERPNGEAKTTETDKALDKGLGLEKEFFTLGLVEARDLFEKRYIEYKLAKNGYNISKTAAAIGLYPSNLHAKLRKYSIRTER